MIRNRVRCKKCRDVIESKYRHDFVTCTCGAVSVDGGNDYMKRLGNSEDFEEMEGKTGMYEVATNLIHAKTERVLDILRWIRP